MTTSPSRRGSRLDCSDTARPTARRSTTWSWSSRSPSSPRWSSPRAPSRSPSPRSRAATTSARARYCLGDQVDVRQSGQFVGLVGPTASGAGKLRFENGRADRRRDLPRRRQASRCERPSATACWQARWRDDPLQAEFAREPPRPGRPEAVAARLHRRRVQARAALGLPRRQDRARAATETSLELEGAGVHGEVDVRRGREDHRRGHLRAGRRGRGRRRRPANRELTLTLTRAERARGRPPSEKSPPRSREFPRRWPPSSSPSRS